MRPNRLWPAPSSISIVDRVARGRNGVSGCPPAMISRARRSARHETPRAGSAFDTVPLPRIVPATKSRVRAMCAMRSKNEKCISGPASTSPTSAPL